MDRMLCLQLTSGWRKRAIKVGARRPAGRISSGPLPSHPVDATLNESGRPVRWAAGGRAGVPPGLAACEKGVVSHLSLLLLVKPTVPARGKYVRHDCAALD